MAKDYFSHDYNARNDKKLTKLFMKHNLAGIGAYWCIIEMLYEDGGYLSINEYERITFELRTEYELIKSVIEDFDLFENDGEKIWSETAIDRLNQRAEKSQKARESIEKRWKKYERTTNVKQPNTKRNTIKERKVKEKESKVKGYREFAHLKISIEENKKLMDYGYNQNEIDSIYDKIENFKQNNKYKSLYLTSLDWLKREHGPRPTKANTGLNKFTLKAHLGETKTFECKTLEEAKFLYHKSCGALIENIKETR